MDIPKKNNSLSRELECPVCLDILDNPKILSSCGHTLCKQCIIIISKENKNNKVATCPYCSIKTEYNEIENLNSNYALINIIEQTNNRISNSCPEKSYIHTINSKKRSNSMPDLVNIDIVTPYLAKPVENKIKENNYVSNEILIENPKNKEENFFSILFSNIMKPCNNNRND